MLKVREGGAVRTSCDVVPTLVPCSRLFRRHPLFPCFYSPGNVLVLTPEAVGGILGVEEGTTEYSERESLSCPLCWALPLVLWRRARTPRGGAVLPSRRGQPEAQVAERASRRAAVCARPVQQPGPRPQGRWCPLCVRTCGAVHLTWVVGELGDVKVGKFPF